LYSYAFGEIQRDQTRETRLLMRPLDGITVVSIEQAVAAPFATRQLADLGARVIKIERPKTGDFARSYDTTVNGLAANFVWLNRSKESVTLDIKHPQSREIMNRLLARADVLVQNLAPGAAARVGLGAEDLLARHPRMIVCEVSGYGDSGPYRDKKAYDLLIQAEAGLIAITGSPGSPAKVGVSIADISAGMYAYSGILASLLQRGKTGKGSILKVSMFEALCEWMTFPLYYQHFGGIPFAPTGASHPAIYPYGPFQSGDGKTVMLGIQNEREWKVFCDSVIERPELADDASTNSVARRVENREMVKAAVDAVFAKLTMPEVIARLDAAGIANSRLSDLESVWNHPQLQARNRWRSVDSSAGAIPALIPPGMPQDSEPRMDPIPCLGGHTDSVLAQLGYSQAEIDALRAASAI
jgi:itaconate CoA-transferase